MALHGDCMELNYTQELLNEHLTFWFVGIFLYNSWVESMCFKVQSVHVWIIFI